MKRIGLGILLSVGFTIALASLTLAGVAYAYRDAYYPGVRVAGITLAGKTKAQVEQDFIARFGKISSSPVTVSVDDITADRDASSGEYPQITLKSTAAELGLNIDVTNALTEAWQVGRQSNPFEWLKAVFLAFTQSSNHAATYSLDTTKVQEFVQTQVATKVVQPTPAKIAIKGDQIVIEDQKPGTAIDVDAMNSDLIRRLPDVLDGEPAMVKAKVDLVDADVTRISLQPLVTQLGLLSNLSLRMTDLNDGKLQPTKAQMLSFFTPTQGEDKKLSIDVNTTALASYIRSSGPRELDVDKSTADAAKTLRQAIADAATTSESSGLAPRQFALTRKPVKTVNPGVFTLGLFEGKYVQVNLAEQKLYQIEGNNLIKTFIISSGKWSTPTPRGTFKVGVKHPRAYSAAYGLYMPYWMNILGTPDNAAAPLNVGEYGLHELPEWPNGYKEGQSHLGIPVSHGCVRLGVGDAAEIYAWIETGTPVVIF